jgi:arsenate reductase (glutaredoxin)
MCFRRLSSGTAQRRRRGRGEIMAKTLTIYGIKNCDTMKKARAWLDQNGVDYAFHDYKSAGIDRATLESWVSEAGWEVLLNRAGTTFRALPEASKTGLSEKKAVALMLAQPSMIKRPVLAGGARLLVGFKPELYAAAFAQKAAVSSAAPVKR